jgi:hypothetical protein
MNGKVKRPMPFESFSVDRNLYFFRVYFDSNLGYRLTVDFDATVCDEFVDLTARTETGGGKEFVDALLSSEHGRSFDTRPLWLRHGNRNPQSKEIKLLRCNRLKIGWQRLTTQQF